MAQLTPAQAAQYFATEGKKAKPISALDWLKLQTSGTPPEADKKTMADYFGSPGTSGNPPVENKQDSDTLSRINEIKKQLGEAQSTLDTYKEAGYTGKNAKNDVKYNASGKIVNANEAYSDYSSYDKAQSQFTSGLDRINTDLEDAKIKQKDAYDKLGTLKTSTYESAYSELGLGDKKAKVEKLDTDITAKSAAITAKTAERDKEFLDENGKPIAQWLITGNLKQKYDRYENELNQLKNEKDTLTTERNGLASEYNAGLDEVDKKVAAAVGDASADISYWDNQVSTLENKATNYQTQLMAILKGTEKGENNTTVVEANGKQYLVTYDTEGNVVSKQDLGTAKTGTDNNDKILSPTEAAALGVEYGTTESEAAGMGITPKKGSQIQLTSAQKDDLATMEVLKKTANDVKELGDSIEWGGVGGFGKGSFSQLLAKNLGWGKSEEQNLRNMIGNITATLAKLRGGTSFTTNEQKLLETYSPTINDSPLSIKSKLDSLIKFIDDRREILGQINSGGINSLNGGQSGGNAATELEDDILQNKTTFKTRELLISNLMEEYPEFTEQQIASKVYTLIPDKK